MITIEKTKNGSELTVKLSGSVEESVQFDTLIGPVPDPSVKSLVVHTKGISRINSVGVKAWIKYFASLQQAGTALKFIECSTAIVEQMNLISNFRCGGAVESIYVPFACQSCKTEQLALFTTQKLKESNLELPELKCAKCSGNSVFDDLPEEYFSFLA